MSHLIQFLIEASIVIALFKGTATIFTYLLLKLKRKGQNDINGSDWNTSSSLYKPGYISSYNVEEMTDADIDLAIEELNER